MNTEHDIDLVERYFDNELSEAETLTLNERLKTDLEFKNMFDQEKALIRSIRASGLRRDLLHLKEVEKQIVAGRKSGQHSMIKPWYYAVAAAFTLFVVATVWLIPARETPEQLFQSYFEPVTNAFETAKRGASETERHAAYQYYDEQNYAMAAEMFGQLLAEKKEPEVLLLSANANLAIGNTNAAMENLLILIRDFDEMDMPAKWYLSLCYLKQGDVEQAKAVLEELERTEVFYTNKAKELLKKVD